MIVLNAAVFETEKITVTYIHAKYYFAQSKLPVKSFRVLLFDQK